MMDLSFYKGKRVLITGHTGFKGSYLTKMLLRLGAEVFGVSLSVEEDSLFLSLGLSEALNDRHFLCDIRDGESLQKIFHAVNPEIVFHLAAQPLVRRSYEEPVLTYETNVLGTVHVLECIRHTLSVRSVINVTTDKVYENRETDYAYRETDRLNGFDPYSNSKSCSELVTETYVRSFFSDRGISVSTMRAGNVIGGGDRNKNRILPDCVRAARAHQPVLLRNPDSIRPYQYVFEPLTAYLFVAAAQEENPAVAGAYNIGPDPSDSKKTKDIAELFSRAWGDGMHWEITEEIGPHEAARLSLDHMKLTETFGYKPTYTIDEAVRQTVSWEKAADKIAETEKQIDAYWRATNWNA